MTVADLASMQVMSFMLGIVAGLIGVSVLLVLVLLLGDKRGWW